MKKLFLVLLVLMFGKISFSQNSLKIITVPRYFYQDAGIGWHPTGTVYPVNQYLGSTNTMVISRGGLMAGQTFVLPSYVDTSSANNSNSFTSGYVGSMIWSTTDSAAYILQKSGFGTYWIKFAGSGGGATGSFWNLTGNYMVNIPAFFGIGTNSNDALPIKTTNITRLVVPADGIANSTTSTDSVLIRKANLEMGVISKAALVGSAGWSLTGNSGLTAGTNFLGTTDATDVVFKRNSSEIMRINATGLGIGSTNPTEKLHVAGNFRLVNGSQVKGNYLSTDANGLSIWRFLVVNVRDYGATGDGVTDDITAIRAATLAAGQSGKIFFPNGTYAISDSINSEYSGQVFEGRGATIKLLNKRHGFKLRHDSCSVIGFKMVGNGSVNTVSNEGMFILIQGASYCKVLNNIFANGSSSAIGILPGATYHAGVRAETSPNYNEVSGNIIKGLPASDTSYSSDHAGVLINYASLLPCNSNIISNNQIYGNNSLMNGIALIGAGHSNLITTNTVKNCRQYGMMLYSTDGQPDNAVTKNTIANNIIDSVGATGTDKGMGIYLQKTIGSIVTGNHISHAEIGATTGSLAQGGITVGYSLRATVTNNIIDSIMTDYPAIFVTSSFFVTLSNNHFSETYIGLRVQSSSKVTAQNNTAVSRNSTVYASTGLSSSSNPSGYASIATGKELNFVNNNFSALAGNPFYFEGSASYPFYYCNVASNTIATAGTGMLGTYLRKSNITGNIITAASGSGNGMQWNDTNDSLYIAENHINRTSGNFTYGIYSEGTQNTINWNKIYNSSTPVSSVSVATSNFFGMMGVNTSSPSTLVHINGAAGFRYVDGNQAAAKVLTSDVNGVATWQNPATAGTVISVASADGSITVTNPTSTVDLAVVKSPILTTARTIGTVTGDATSAGSTFNGSANNTNALTLATVNSNVGSFTNASVTVNAKGLVTAASSGSTPEVPLTFSNGLTRTSNTVTLGGTLTGNTTLSSASGYQLAMLDTSGTNGTTFGVYGKSATDASQVFYVSDYGRVNGINHMIATFVAPAMIANDYSYIRFGTTTVGATSNTGFIRYDYVGSNSASNAISIGFQNSQVPFRITGAGNINLSNLTASLPVFTDASKNLTSTGPGTTAQYIRGDGSLATTPTGTVTGTGTTPQLAYWSSSSGLTGDAGITRSASGALTVTTSATTPLIIGGTTTTSDLNLQTTSGVGTTGADMHFLVGNNGATEAMTILNNANVGIGTTPSVKLDVLGSATSGVNIVGKFVGGTSASAGGIQIGNYTGTYGGVWSNNVTASTINFLLASDGAVSYFNATNNAITSINGNTVVNTTSTGSAITGTLGVTGDVGLSTASAGIVTIGGGATASKLRFMEPSGSGSNYSEFQSVAQSANITYSLPPTVGAAGTVLTDVAGNGVLTWAAGGGGGGWGTTGTVATLTGDAKLQTDIYSFGIGNGTYTNFFNISPSSATFSMGDVNSDVNGTQIFADDGAATMYYQANNGHQFEGAVTFNNNPLGKITSGTYTPTLSNTTNVAASTAYACQYMRVGNTVTVSGKVDIDVTLTATSTVLGMTLPIASAIANTNELGGTGYCPTVAAAGTAILGDATNDRATIQFVSTDTNNISYFFTFTYRIL